MSEKCAKNVEFFKQNVQFLKETKGKQVKNSLKALVMHSFPFENGRNVQKCAKNVQFFEVFGQFLKESPN